MTTKSKDEKTTEEEGIKFKSLIAPLLFTTAIVVVVGLLGRRAGEK